MQRFEFITSVFITMLKAYHFISDPRNYRAIRGHKAEKLVRFSTRYTSRPIGIQSIFHKQLNVFNISKSAKILLLGRGDGVFFNSGFLK